MYSVSICISLVYTHTHHCLYHVRVDYVYNVHVTIYSSNTSGLISVHLKCTSLINELEFTPIYFVLENFEFLRELSRT